MIRRCRASDGKEVEHLKNEFIMAASHELRTPLTSVSMGIDLILAHMTVKLSDKDQELLLAAHEEISRLKILVNGLCRIKFFQKICDFSNKLM